jgi:hypothetical protein
VSIIITNSKRLQEFNFLNGGRTQRLLCLGSHIPLGMALMGAYVTRVMCMQEGGRENKIKFNSTTLETKK